MNRLKQLITSSSFVSFSLLGGFIGAMITASSAEAASMTRLNFLGQAEIPGTANINNDPIGGLSGITYDSVSGNYYAISDDRNDPRFYTVNIDLSSGFLASNGANVTNVTNLRDSVGNLLGAGVADTEGITLSNDGNVFISSEGIGSEADLFIREFDISTGNQLDDLTIPTKFLTDGTNAGVRRNLGFESLTFSPDKSTLFTTTERALFQDSSDADLAAGDNLLRILQFDQSGNTYDPGSEFLYQPENSHRVTDLLALDNQKLLSVERGDSIKIFEVSLGGATDISANDALNSSIAGITSVEKNLLLDFSTLDTPLSGKFEGITFGSILPNGQRSLLLVSDNDFEGETSTKFVAFSVQSVPFTSSPLLGFFMIGGWAIAYQLKKTKI